MERLAALEPLRIITGYGPPMQGDRMLRGLHDLARNFERLAVPPHGRYIGHPALADETGVVAVPPPVPDPLPRIALGLGIGLLLAAALRKSSRPVG